jgi:hypothetical protein
MANEG